MKQAISSWNSKPRFPRGFVLSGTESDQRRDQQAFTGIPAGILAGFLAWIPAERSTT
jgi:hypothetical protein